MRSLLWKTCPVKLDSIVEYESSSELGVKETEMLKTNKLLFAGNHEFRSPE